MYDMKKQLASMALTLRNVSVLDTKASVHTTQPNNTLQHLLHVISGFRALFCTSLLLGPCTPPYSTTIFPSHFRWLQIDNFDASLTRMVKYLLSSPQVRCGCRTVVKSHLALRHAARV